MEAWISSAAERRAERTQKVALIALADLAENRDTDTGEHILRVARLTHEITRELAARGLRVPPDFMRNVGLASILHDVGKVAVPDSILLKPGPLDADERRQMETHTLRGAAVLRKAAAMLAGSVQFELAAEIAEFHHERWDGKGYPHGLAAEAIPLSARIVAVADVYDALTSDRPYKKAWPELRALEYVAEQAGAHFDPQVAEALTVVLEARAQARSIPWTTAMSVGDETMDHDHRILLALVNQVSGPGTASDPIALEFVLDELLGYTALHFAREEKLMESMGYPDLEEHRTIHRQMLDEVRQLQLRLGESHADIGDDLTQFLGDWLTRHILVEDRRYASLLPRETP